MKTNTEDASCGAIHPSDLLTHHFFMASHQGNCQLAISLQTRLDEVAYTDSRPFGTDVEFP